MTRTLQVRARHVTFLLGSTKLTFLPNQTITVTILFRVTFIADTSDCKIPIDIINREHFVGLSDHFKYEDGQITTPADFQKIVAIL